MNRIYPNVKEALKKNSIVLFYPIYNKIQFNCTNKVFWSPTFLLGYNFFHEKWCLRPIKKKIIKKN